MRILDFVDGFESSIEPTSIATPASSVAVTPSGNLSSTTAQTALQELQGDIDTINAKVGANSGIATLDSNGKLPVSQVPAIAIVDVYVVANIAARDALTVQSGDVAQVTDAGGGVTETYQYNGTSWTDLKSNVALAAHSALTTGIHGVSGNIVGDSDAQVLTNKDIDGGAASNTRRITLPKATKTTLDALTRKQGTIVYATDDAKAYIDNGTTLVPVGSGSGGGTVNFVTNPKAETDVSSTGVYNDGVTSRPVDGNGGTVTSGLTLTREATGGLDTTDFLITKPASNVQGQGYSWDVVIPRYMRGKVVQIAINYEIGSGTYSGGSSTTDSDLIAYIYSVTDSKLIEPAPMKLDGGVVGVQYKYVGTFQTSTTDASLRLLLHHATTSTAAFTMKVTASVSPQVVSGSSFSAFRAYRNTSQTGVNPNNSFVKINIDSVSGDTDGAFNVSNCRYEVKIGGWYSFNANLTVASTNVLANNYALAIYKNGSLLEVGENITATASTDFKRAISTAPALLSAGDYIELYLFGAGNNSASTLTISGSATTTVFGGSRLSIGTPNSETDTKVVAARYSTAAATPITTSGVTIDYNVLDYDTHSAVTTGAGTWKFTAPFPGVYEIKGYFQTVASVNAAGDRSRATVYKNGAAQFDIGSMTAWATNNCSYRYNMAGSIYLKANEYISIVADQAVTANLAGASSVNWISIHRLSGPSQIAASEVIKAKYRSSAGQSVPVGGAVFVAGTKVHDSHLLYNPSTGVFSVQSPGLYRINASIQYASASFTANAAAYIGFRKNSTAQDYALRRVPSTSTTLMDLNGYTEIECNTGDTLDVYAGHNESSARNLSTDASVNFLSIVKVG